jgi:hypothetical protein
VPSRSALGGQLVDHRAEMVGYFLAGRGCLGDEGQLGAQFDDLVTDTEQGVGVDLHRMGLDGSGRAADVGPAIEQRRDEPVADLGETSVSRTWISLSRSARSQASA